MSVFDGYFTPPGKAIPIDFSRFRSNTRTRCTMVVYSIDTSMPTSECQAPGRVERSFVRVRRPCSSASANVTAEICRTRVTRVSARRERDRASSVREV